MPDAHSNFATSLVATAPSPAMSGTSLVVTAAQGTRFPAVPFNAVICPVSADATPANAEVVRVTARSTDTFTITRGPSLPAPDTSSARAVVVGDRIYAGITAKTLTDVEAFFNVKSYGATGDGTTDDTAAIAAALAALPTNGALYFPPGTYVTGQLTNRSNYTLFGNGATIKRKSGVSGTLFTSGAFSGVTVRDLAFDNLASSSPIFSYVAPSVDLEVRGCRFTNFNSYVILIGAGSGQSNEFRCVGNTFISNSVTNTSAVQANDCSWTWFENNYVENIGAFKAETSSSTPGTMHHISVRGNVIRNSIATVLQIRNNGAGTLEDVIVSGNQANGIGSTSVPKGLVVIGEGVGTATNSRARRITVTGNVVKDYWGNAVEVGGGPTPGIVEDLVVSNNVLDATQSDGTVDLARDTAGVFTVNAFRFAINGNVIRGTGRSGIRVVSSGVGSRQGVIGNNHVSLCAQNPDVTGPTIEYEAGITTYGGVHDVTITGNTCQDQGSEAGQGVAGIGTSNHTVSGHVIVGNRCFDSRGTPFQDYGIRTGITTSGTSPTNFTITNNDVRGNVTAGLYFAASAQQHNIFNNMGATTAKGDLVVSDGTSLRIVPAGTNGQVLTADSTTAAGVKWA